MVIIGVTTSTVQVIHSHLLQQDQHSVQVISQLSAGFIELLVQVMKVFLCKVLVVPVGMD